MFKHQIKNDPEIEGLLFVCYDDGSGGASYKGNYFATADYATGQYKIGNGEWDVLNTGTPDDNSVYFEDACRRYVLDNFNENEE